MKKIIIKFYQTILLYKSIHSFTIFPFIICLVFLFVPQTNALEMSFQNPTYWDLPIQIDSTCISTDLIWYDEGDWTGVWVSYAPYHYCVQLWYDWSVSYLTDTWIADPDVCETNSSQITQTPVWRLDTSWTNNYTSITCTISDSKVWCTQPNALNYSPVATMDDWTCFYTDSTQTWSTFSFPSELTLSWWIISNQDNFMNQNELFNFYQFELTFLLLFTLIVLIHKLWMTWKNKSNKYFYLLK